MNKQASLLAAAAATAAAPHPTLPRSPAGPCRSTAGARAKVAAPLPGFSKETDPVFLKTLGSFLRSVRFGFFFGFLI